MTEDNSHLPAKVERQKGDITKRPEKEWVANTKTGTMVGLKGALSLVPGGGFVTEAINGVEARAQRRQIQALERVVELLNEELSIIGQKLQSDDELADLWTRGLRAVRTATMQTKVEAFATILAGSVDADRNQRITYNALIKVLEELDEEHLQIMLTIETEASETPPDDDEGKPNLAGARIPALEEAIPHLRPILGLLLNALLSLQLIRNAYEDTWGALNGMKAYRLTDLGARLLTILRSGERMSQPEEKAD